MSLITWNKAIFLAGLLAATLGAQTPPICGLNDTVTVCNTPDAGGNAMLSGTYFVREIQIVGLNPTGTSLSTAYSVMGTMTFTPTLDSNGNGEYTFSGQELESTVTTGVFNYTYSSSLPAPTYRVSGNGTLYIQDLLFSESFNVGEVGANGAFVASNSGNNSSNIVIMVGIPVNSTTPTLSGNYYGAYIDFYQANISTIREAWFPFTASGGNIGTLAVTGAGTDLGNTIQTQQMAGVGYAFSGNTGTLNFGGAGASNFVSGTQTFNVSADGSMILGGTPGDYDLLVGIKALGGTASNASLKGVYVLGGFQNDASVPGSNIFEAFTGSTSATGTGTSITHREIMRSDTSSIQDYTSATQYTVPASGVFTPGDRYQYALGANGTFLATGQSELYSVMLGLQAPALTATGSVWLNPEGIVNAANSAPFTNPVAPNELLTLYGQGLAPSAMSAPAYVFPLPTSLNGVQVYVNGGDPYNNYAPAPLLYVSPTVINMVEPSDWYPNNGWGFATFQVCVGTAAACAGGTGTYSNAVWVRTQNTAPGVFDLTGSATGQAAVAHANTATIANSSNPAHPGDIVSIFATGLGNVENQPNDGYPPQGAGPFTLPSAWSVYMGGVQCDPSLGTNYAGLAPGYVGLYQINVTVPKGTGTGNVPLEVYVDNAPTSGLESQSLTVETTINIAASAAAAVH
ncbi:MAG: hypothetical protein ABSF98_14830 [Bryobacteraceae bacterium]|jgi:uncharacterized protein (TIGR03437 family)